MNTKKQNSGKINSLHGLAQFALFVSSYLPLFILIIARQVSENMDSFHWAGFTSEGLKTLILKFGLSLVLTIASLIGLFGYIQIETNQLMNKLSLVFLIIILFVGGISIGNYIWANVNERRKEIGILRMIGYHKRHIYFILINKALILGFIGGILGYIIGTLGAVWLGPQFAGIEVTPLYYLLFISIGISISISMLGSAIPAYLAGKIEPFSNMQED